jgi:CheY-specific phosphatase CheX
MALVSLARKGQAHRNLRRLDQPTLERRVSSVSCVGSAVDSMRRRRVQPSERADFRDIVIAACRHVLPSCGLPIDPNPVDLDTATDRTEQLASFIGFSATVLRGAVTMVVPVPLARRSYPLIWTDGGDDKLALFDWCGEIANRLLGRIKHGLSARGVDVEASTPTAVMAEHMRLVTSDANTVCAVRFHCVEAAVSIIVDAMSPQNQPVFRALQASATTQPEGELLLL